MDLQVLHEVSSSYGSTGLWRSSNRAWKTGPNSTKQHDVIIIDWMVYHMYSHSSCFFPLSLQCITLIIIFISSISYNYTNKDNKLMRNWFWKCVNHRIHYKSNQTEKKKRDKTQKRSVFSTVQLIWLREQGPQSGRTNQALRQRWGWGSCPQTASAAVPCPAHQHRPQSRWQIQQPDHWTPQRDQLQDGGKICVCTCVLSTARSHQLLNNHLRLLC